MFLQNCALLFTLVSFSSKYLKEYLYYIQSHYHVFHKFETQNERGCKFPSLFRFIDLEFKLELKKNKDLFRSLSLITII